jgi:thiol-disulfide isomerase/thioredoxin
VRPLICRAAVLRTLAWATLSLGCATVRPALVGQPFAPPLTTLEGTPFDWSVTKGHVVVVDIWASWCHSCAAELPALQAIGKDTGFAYVGLNVDADPRAALSFREAIGAQGVLTLSDRGAHFVEGHVEITQLPTRLLLDRAGRVRLVQDGFKPGDEARIRSAIESLAVEPIPTGR